MGSQDEKISELIANQESMKETIKRLQKSIQGNGQPGLINDVAKLQVTTEVNHSEIEKIQHSRESDHRFIFTAIVTALFSLIAAIFNLTR